VQEAVILERKKAFIGVNIKNALRIKFRVFNTSCELSLHQIKMTNNKMFKLLHCLIYYSDFRVCEFI